MIIIKWYGREARERQWKIIYISHTSKLIEQILLLVKQILTTNSSVTDLGRKEKRCIVVSPVKSNVVNVKLGGC